LLLCGTTETRGVDGNGRVHSIFFSMEYLRVISLIMSIKQFTKISGEF